MRVTEKGQVTIPKTLRDRFGIAAGTDVEFHVRGDALVLRTSAQNRRGRRIADRLRGLGDVPLSTEEIMALARSAD